MSKIPTRDELIFAKLHFSACLYGKFSMATRTKKLITLPTFKFVTDVPLNVVIIQPMHIGVKREGRGSSEADKKKEPPTLARVINLDTGEEGQIILASVLKTELAEAYKNDSYVGKAFEMIKQKRKEGKQYDPYSLAELDLNAEEQATADAAVAALKPKEAPPAVEKSAKK